MISRGMSVDEVILVDDASHDETVGLARSLSIPTLVHERKRGYGANQKTCCREALLLGELSCPAHYFADASSINFCRSVLYGVGVL